MSRNFSLPWLLLSLLGLTATAQTGEGPSFDCERARSWSELTLCVDPRLAELDRRMAALYGELRQALPTEGEAQLREDQRAFLAQRERCQQDSDEPRVCLARRYRARIELLASQLGRVGQTLPAPTPVTSALDECWEVANNRVELAPCLDRKLDSASQWLERAQQQTLAAMAALEERSAQSGAVAAYESARDAFYRFRDANCSWYAAATGGGTGQGDVYRACLVDTTRQRAAELERQLPGGQNE